MASQRSNIIDISNNNNKKKKMATKFDLPVFTVFKF